MKYTLSALFAALLLAFTPQAQAQTLAKGDIAVVGMNAGTDTVLLVPLVDLAVGTVIVITDVGVLPSTGALHSTSTGDGTVTWTVAGASVPKGSLLKLVLGGSDNAPPTELTNLTTGTSYTAQIALSAYTVTDPLLISGDQILIYQGSAASPSFIFGLNNSGAAVDATNWNTVDTPTLIISRIPPGLTNGTDAIGLPGGTSQQDNVQYIGITTAATRAVWQSRLTNLANWGGDSAASPGTTVNSIPNGGIAISLPLTTVSSLTRVNTSPTNAATVNWTMTLASATTGVTASNFSLTGTATSGASVGTPTTSNGGVTWNVPVTTGTGSGTVILNLNNSIGTNPTVSNVPFTGDTYAMDKAAPTVAMSSSANNPTGTSPIPVTVIFSESVTGFAAGDITPGNGTVNNFAGSGSSYTFDLVPSGQGLVTANIGGSVAQDAAGNGNSAATQFSRTFDSVAPTVTINQAGGQADPASTSPINFTVVFNEPVTGFANGDISLSGTAGATTAVVSGGPSTYNVAVSGMSGNGTVIAAVNLNAAQDAAGNNSTASTSTDSTVNYAVAPAYDLSLTLSEGTLNIDASTSAGATNVTLRLVTGAGGPFVEIFDATRTIGASPGMTQVNANTVRVPFASITSITLTGTVLADSFAFDFSHGDFCPSGGISVAGGGPTVAPGDVLSVDGDFISGSSYSATGAGAGTLVLDASNVIAFTGLEPVDLSAASFSDFAITVDPSSTVTGNVTTTVTAVDAGVNTLVSFSGGLESAKLGSVTGTLTINGDNVDSDYFMLRGMGTAMAGHFAIDGKGGDADVIDIYNGTIALAAGKNLSLKADHIALGMDTAGTNIGTINVSGNITLEADGDNSITTPPLWDVGGVWGTSVPAYFSTSALFNQRGSIQVRGQITKTAGADATATLKARAGIGFMNVAANAGTITSSNSKLHVIVNADSDASNSGGVILQNLSAITTNGGNVTIGGGADPAAGPAVGVAGGGATAGVFVANAAITTAGGNVSIRGKGFGANTGLGILIQASGASAGNPRISTDTGSITMNGTGGGTIGLTSTCHGISVTGQAAKPVELFTTTGTISMTGAATTGNNNGVLITGMVDISASGAGSINLTASGFGFGIGLGVTAGTGLTARVKSVGGNLVFTCDTINLENGFGIKTYETSGAGSITVKQLTNGQNIGVGAADALTTLGISSTELGLLNAPTVAIGDSHSGTVTVNTVISPATFRTLALASGAGTTFAATSGFSADVTSASIYEKITVAGTVDIAAGATFSAASAGGYVWNGTDTFTFLANDLADAISGTFTGPTLTNFLGSSLTAAQSYTDGSGNDFLVGSFAPTLVSIAVTPANPSIAKGTTQPFMATGTYSDNSTANLTSTVTWASADPGVATISSGGLATSVDAGTSSISATSGAVTGSTTLTVTPPPLVSIAVTPVNPSIVVGGTQPFTATGTYADSSTEDLTSTVTWASADPGVATISSGGLATGVNAGTSSISAKSGAVSGSTTLTVSLVAQAITFNLPPTAVETDVLTLSATGGASGNPVTFSVQSGPGSLSGGNSLSFTGTGPVVVKASQAGGGAYAAAADVLRTIMVSSAGSLVANDTAYARSSAVLINVLANDSTAGGPLTLTAVTQPASGGKTKILSGQVHFTPSGAVSTPLTFTYTASNGTTSGTATVTVRPQSSATGTFVGLLRRADDSIRGRAVLTIAATGALSGNLRYENNTYAVKGSLNSVEVTVTGKAPVPRPLILTTSGFDALGQPMIGMKLMHTTPAQMLTGTAERSPYSAGAPTTQAGTYTMITELPSGGSGPALGAAMTCTVSADGTVKFGGKLGTGLAITQTGKLLGGGRQASGGRLPFFVSQGVQRTGGVLLFDKTLAPAIDGTLRWSVPNGAAAQIPGGLEQDYEVLGLRYTPAINAAAMFSPAAPTATMTHVIPSLGVGSPVVRTLTLSGAANKGTQKIYAAAPGTAYVTFSTATGLFTGSRTISKSVTRSFFGVVLQGAGINEGQGVLVEPTTLNSVTIVP